MRCNICFEETDKYFGFKPGDELCEECFNKFLALIQTFNENNGVNLEDAIEMFNKGFKQAFLFCKQGKWNLSNMNLRGADFSGLKLNSVNFNGSDILYCKWENTEAIDCDFRNCYYHDKPPVWVRFNKFGKVSKTTYKDYVQLYTTEIIACWIEENREEIYVVENNSISGKFANGYVVIESEEDYDAGKYYKITNYDKEALYYECEDTDFWRVVKNYLDKN